MTSQSLSWRQKVRKTCHDVKKFVMSSNTRHYVKYTSKVRHDVKNTSWRQKDRHKVKNTSWRQKHVMMSKTRHDIKHFIMTSTDTSWRQKLSHWRQQILTPIWHFYDVSLPSYQWLYVKVSQFRWHWPWPLTYSSDIAKKIRYYTQLPHIKFCNNRPTYNEVTVWYRAADTQIHRQTPALQ